MQEKELKTSLSQRIIIGIIAVLLFASTIAIYALIVLNHIALRFDHRHLCSNRVKWREK